MDQAKALQGLIEAAELAKLVEELSQPEISTRLSSASSSAIRVTIRNLREMILSSHDALASQLISRNRITLDGSTVGSILNGSTRTEENGTAAASSDSNGTNGTAAMSRRDLRASLERIIERQ